MSNIKLDNTTPLGPFFHKGGLIAVSSPYYVNGVIKEVDPVKMGFELKAGWYFNLRDQNGIIVIRGHDHRASGFDTEKEAQKGYERWLKRIKWKIIWRDAVNNMPKRLGKEKETWVEVPRGATSLPDFVIGNALDEMKFIGQSVFKKVMHRDVFGQPTLLCRLMGYTYTNKATGKMLPDSNGFYHVRTGGMKPRSVEKQKLAMRYASGEGKALAWQKLRELGKAHLYHD